MRHRRLVGLGISVLITCAGSALGQEAPARPEKPPLQGPTVKENRAPHVDDQFADGMKQGRMGPQIPMRAYADVIGKLRGEQAPADIRLSEEQEKKLGAIEQEYRDAVKAFTQQTREERGEGQPRRGPKGGGGGAEGGGGKGGGGGGQRREMAQEIMKNGPRPSDFQTRIWAVLNEKQQAHVKVELDKVRDEMVKRRGEEYMQRRIEQQKGGKPQDGAQPPRPGAAGPEGEPRPLRERGMKLMRRIAQLPEAEREQLIKRIEAELDRRGIPEAPDVERPPSSDKPPEKSPERSKDK